MIAWLWLVTLPVLAIDNNDHLILELDGGERVEGWYLKVDEDVIVMSVPETGTTARIPTAIVKSAAVNNQPMPLDAFKSEVEEEWGKIVEWRLNPPPHPSPVLVGGVGFLLAGTGHAWLGEKRIAVPMMIADTALMSTLAVEASGHGTGRVDIFFTAALLSTLFKTYAMTEGFRQAKKRRVKLGFSAPRYEKSRS